MPIFSRFRAQMLWTIVLATCSSAVYASLPAMPPQPLLTALEKGDADTVHRLEKELGASQETRALDDAQLRYDIPHLGQLASQCELSRFSQGSPGDLLLALRCNEIARSSALQLGDANAYVKEALWAKKVLLPALTKASGGPATFDNGLDTTDLETLLPKVPKVSSAWSEGTHPMKYHNTGAPFPASSPLQAPIVVGDHLTTARIATNLTAITPLRIVSTTAGEKALGFTPLIKNIGTARIGFQSRVYSLQIDLYLAPSIRFGPLTLSNVAVAILHSEDVLPELAVGMPFLRQFGEVTIENDQIQLARTAQGRCKGGAPLTLASDSFLNGPQTFPTTIGGKAALTSFDSDVAPSILVKPGLSETVSGGKPVSITAGSWTSQQSASPSLASEKLQDAILGVDILKDNSVQLRFDTKSPSICLFANSK